MKIFTSYRRTILPGLAGLVGILAIPLLSLVNEYQNANQHARIEVENISRMLEEHALSTVQKADLLMRDVLGDVHPDDMRLARASNSPRARELHALLKSHAETVPELQAVHLTNAKGEHIHSSLAELPPITILDRPYFNHQRTFPDAGLVISPPLVSRTTGNWTLVLTRRINFEDGSFAGTITGILDPEYFQKFYRSLDMGKNGTVTLFDREMNLIARFPPLEKDMGSRLNLVAKTYIEKGMNHATYRTKSVLDGVDRMYNFRQVGDLPLFVFTGLATDDYLSEWRRHAWEYGGGLVIFCFVLARFWQRQRRAEEALRRSEENLGTIADYTYDWEYWEGPHQELLYMSPSCERITGYALADFMDDPKLLYRIIHPGDRHLMEEHHAHAADQEVAGVDFRIVRSDGEMRWIAHGCQAVYGKDGRCLGRRASNRDITERKRIETALRESHQQTHSLLNSMAEGAYGVDQHGNCTFVNRSFLRILGYDSADEIIGKHIHELIHHSHPDGSPYPATECKMFNVYRQNQEVHVTDEVFWNKDGVAIPVEYWSQPILVDNVIQGKIATFIDITERKATEAQIGKLAFYDILTQLPNRRLLSDRLSQAMAAGKRSGHYGALLFLDLDNFKSLNDTHGHAVGDLLLTEVARRISGCVRESDTVARFGGDEFVVILSELKESRAESAAQAGIVAEKIRIALAEPYLLTIAQDDNLQNTVEHHCTSSIGVVLFIDHEATQGDILKWADRAMYQAKEDGHNLTRFYDPRRSIDAPEIDHGALTLRLIWHESYACGEPVIDSEHRTFFELGNALIESALKRKENPQKFDADMEKLLAHAVQHFADEEAILAQHQYADLDIHARAHRALIEHALRLRDAAAAGRLTIGELVDYLADEVIAQHMLKTDREFYPLFKNALHQ